MGPYGVRTQKYLFNIHLWWKSNTAWTFGMHGLKSLTYLRKQSTRTCWLTSTLCFLFLQNATLKELNICRGDTLVIAEGQLPPKVKRKMLFVGQLTVSGGWNTFLSFFSLVLILKILLSEKFRSAIMNNAFVLQLFGFQSISMIVCL